MHLYEFPRLRADQVYSIPWKGDYVEYDLGLHSLGNGLPKFVAVNPTVDQELIYQILEVPKTDKCFVWYHKGTWAVKLFPKDWHPAYGYDAAEIDKHNKAWQRNKSLGLLTFDKDPRKSYRYIESDLDYELVWYLDPAWNPGKDKVWAFKFSLPNKKLKGTKDMGYITPEVIDPSYNIIFNRSVNWKSFKDKNNAPVDFDLKDKLVTYDHVWYLDPSQNIGKDRIWVAKVKPTFDNILGHKDMGFVTPNFPEKLDVVFMSYNEPNAEDNWQRLLEKAPWAKRVSGVKGILNAHKAAAELAETDMFYIVDGDAFVNDDWEFNFQPIVFDRDCVHVWHSQNPVNGLTYGYGGVKLFPRDLLRQAETSGTDVTTSVGKKLKVIETVSNITKFNTNEFETWRCAFRESAKLAKLDTEDARQRLNGWLKPIADADFSEWAKLGAEQGLEFSLANDDIDLVNNFEELRNRFNKKYGR